MTLGWLLLAGAVLAYGLGNLLQAVGALREDRRDRVEVGLLVRLATRPVYLAGFAAQLAGGGLAFLARADLPLFVVQAGSAAAIGVTALLGAAILGWRLRGVEIGLLVGLGAGLAALAAAAAPSTSRPLTVPELVGLAAAVPVLAVAALGAGRVPGPRGAMALGALAGLAFGAVAVGARALADTTPLWTLVAEPGLYVIVAHIALGQVLFATALQRGSTTGAVAAMEAAAAVPAAVAGLLLLGDRVVAGREPLVPIGLAVVLAAVIALSAVVRPLHPAAPAPTPAPEPAVPR